MPVLPKNCKAERPTRRSPVGFLFCLYIYYILNVAVCQDECKMQNAKCKIEVAFLALLEKHTGIILFRLNNPLIDLNI